MKRRELLKSLLSAPIAITAIKSKDSINPTYNQYKLDQGKRFKKLSESAGLCQSGNDCLLHKQIWSEFGYPIDGTNYEFKLLHSARDVFAKVNGYPVPAQVNGKIVTLGYTPQVGDTVEILSIE